MDGIVFIAAIVLLMGLLVGAPIGVSYIIIRIVEKKGYNRKWKLIALLPLLTVGYFIYTAIYPTEDFYKTDFKEVTGVNFPIEARIQYKSSTFPDPFGDYQSISVVKVSRSFYDSLPSILINKGLVQQQNRNDPFIIEDLLRKFDD